MEGLTSLATRKIYIIVNHISSFIKQYNIRLRNFAEQAGEEVHSKIKPNWKRYKVSKQHIKHGEK